MPRTSLFRTSSFRLAALYLALFTISVLVLGAVVYLVVWREIVGDIDEDVKAETSVLAREYAAHGVDSLKAMIEARSQSVNSFAYGLQDAEGHRLTGVLFPSPAQPGWTWVSGPPEDSGVAETARSLVTRLEGGAVLVVGVDWRNEQSVTHAIFLAFVWALAGMLALGTIGGLFLGSQVLKRIEAMNNAARAIVAGDWRRRIPETGANDELAELARTFNRTFDRIQSLLAANRHVGDNIAHDLRRPLGRAVHRLEAARGDGSTQQDAETAIDVAIADIRGVLETFSAILRIGQIEAGARRAAFKSVDLASIAREVVEAFLPSADEEDKVLVVDLECALPLSGDHELLTQMIANLVDNGMRHTPRGARITVASERAAGAGRLKVADDGPGAPPGELSRIFERFYRLDAARATPGDGLGLSLVAAIAELHGLECIARDNRPGLSIVLSLPAQGVSG